MGAALIGAGLLGAGLNVGGTLASAALGGGGKIKGKTATDRRIRERYQTQVKDLRLAGLNPMLAYTQPPASTGTGTAFAQSLPFSAAGAAQQLMDSYGRARKVSPEETLLGAQAGHQDAAANKERSAAKNLDEMHPYLKAQGDFYRTPLGKKAVEAEALLRPLGAVGAVTGAFLGGRMGRGRLQPTRAKVVKPKPTPIKGLKRKYNAERIGRMFGDK